MHYLFLRYEDKPEGKGFAAATHPPPNEACLSNDQALRESGYLLKAGYVSRDIIIVQFVQDQLTLTTGPLAAASEPLTSFCLIQARDLNEAIQIAARMPQVRRGRIVVAPMSNQ